MVPEIIFEKEREVRACYQQLQNLTSYFKNTPELSILTPELSTLYNFSFLILQVYSKTDSNGNPDTHS